MSETTTKDAEWRAEFYADVALRLQLLRKQQGLRQADVAEALDISRASYANIEGARQRVTADVLWKLAVVLRVPATKLMPTPRPAHV